MAKGSNPRPKLMRKLLKELLSCEKREDLRVLLKSIEEEMERTENEWEVGYLTALRNLAYQRLNSPSKGELDLSKTSEEQLEKLLETFEELSEDPLLSGFDKGYFEALARYLSLSGAQGFHQRQLT